MPELITTHTFGNGAPIDYYEWKRWQHYRQQPHSKTVRIAGRRGGWKSLIIGHKPKWLIYEEESEEIRALVAHQMSLLNYSR